MYKELLNKLTSREFMILVAGIVLLVTDTITLTEFAAITGIGVGVLTTQKIVKKKTD